MAVKKKELPEYGVEIFENELFGQIRYVRPDPDFDPWFVAVDVCRALDIKNSRDAVSNLDDDEKMTVILIDSRSKNGVTNTLNNIEGIRGATFGGWIENRVTVVSEPGLYRLIFMSRKPEAKKFKRWTFHDVLPSIRKYGYYLAPYQKIIEIKGAENLEKFKAKYPAGAVEVKDIFVETDIVNEYGEESMAYFRYKVVVHSSEREC